MCGQCVEEERIRREFSGGEEGRILVSTDTLDTRVCFVLVAAAVVVFSGLEFAFNDEEAAIRFLESGWVFVGARSKVFAEAFLEMFEAAVVGVQKEMSSKLGFLYVVASCLVGCSDQEGVSVL